MIPIKDACKFSYNEIRKSYKDKSSMTLVIEQIPYYFWRGYPLYGIFKDSETVEPINNTPDRVPYIKEYKIVKGLHESFNYTEVFIKRSDMLKFIKDYKKEKGLSNFDGILYEMLKLLR